MDENRIASLDAPRGSVDECIEIYNTDDRPSSALSYSLPCSSSPSASNSESRLTCPLWSVSPMCSIAAALGEVAQLVEGMQTGEADECRMVWAPCR